MRSVLQPWVMELPLMQQATLITGTRGPDGVCKQGKHKEIARYLRYLTLVAANPDHMDDPQDTFMCPDLWQVGNNLVEFINDHDQYPVHWIMHMVHAYQVLGYKHPDPTHRERCYRFYVLMCDAFHLLPEDVEPMDRRLNL